ncbi:MAG: tRNA guanosine(34) transglycosylase Tgt [Patescibacteria group bacterium]|nr:tRNA guanosine(34) transglycosylase Tgt [Patescibacteria group bacterium]
MSIGFEIKNRDGKARSGVITTGHGSMRTPLITVNFTPALLRSGLKPSDVKELGSELILVNTLHAYLSGMRDVHEDLGWEGPVLADSGGFQMISLADKMGATAEGVEFEINGEAHFFDPKKVLEIQRSIGVDMMMPLDYVVSVRTHSLALFLTSVTQTRLWFGQAALTGTENLYYIVQGGTSSVARWLSVKDANRWLRAGVEAVALGGISLGETKQEIYDTVKFCCDRLVEDRPRHLLGVGDPEDLLECVERGIDTFDCVSTTRLARHGRVWTFGGVLRLRQEQFGRDQSVLEPGCDCPTCRAGESRAALREGLRDVNEAVVRETKLKLMKHNIRFVNRLMEGIRQAIEVGELAKFKAEFLAIYKR